jgi:hypothetical protein
MVKFQLLRLFPSSISDEGDRESNQKTIEKSRVLYEGFAVLFSFSKKKRRVVDVNPSQDPGLCTAARLMLKYG